LGNVFQAKKIEEEKRQHALAIAFGKEIMSQVPCLHALPNMLITLFKNLFT
jgi:hypothetical protein